LLSDELLPALQIPMPDRAVHVDDALLEALEKLEVERAIVDGLLDLQEEPRVEERHEVGHRIQGAVDRLADAVADGEWFHEREDQERPGPDAVEPQRLPEVLTALFD